MLLDGYRKEEAAAAMAFVLVVQGADIVYTERHAFGMLGNRV